MQIDSTKQLLETFSITIDDIELIYTLLHTTGEEKLAEKFNNIHHNLISNETLDQKQLQLPFEDS